MPEVSGLEALPALLAVHAAPGRHGQRLDARRSRRDLAGPGAGRGRLLAQTRAKPARRDARQPRPADRQGTGAAQSRVRRPRRTPPPATTSTSSATTIKPRPARSRPPGSGSAPTSTSTSAADTGPWLRLHRHRHLHRRPAGAQPGLPATGPAHAADPDRPAHARTVHRHVFAERLNRYSTLTVKEAEEGDLVLPDRVLVAPGGRHMALAGLPPRRAGHALG